MIEINLVPQNLRKKRKQEKSSWEIPVLPKETIIGVGGGFVVLLIFLHIVLQGFITMKYIRLKEYKKEWNEILPAKSDTDKIIELLNKTQQKIKPIEQAMGGRRILWSQKLNEISDSIPRGVWINKVSFAEDLLILQGSSASKENTEILDVHKFASNLKKEENFRKYFSAIEVGIQKTIRINAISIADFTINAQLE